jgi:tetratricopeptide (TPR) repeat protein
MATEEWQKHSFKIGQGRMQISPMRSKWVPPTQQPIGNEGVAELNLKDFSGAIEDATAALRLSENDAAAYLLRAEAKARTSDQFGARDDLNEAIQLNPNLPRAYQIRAQVRKQLGDLEGAREDERRTKRFSPE